MSGHDHAERTVSYNGIHQKSYSHLMLYSGCLATGLRFLKTRAVGIICLRISALTIARKFNFCLHTVLSHDDQSIGLTDKILEYM